jgi:hypothetical protein
MKELNEIELRTFDGGTLSYDNADNYNALISNTKYATPYAIELLKTFLRDIIRWTLL